MIDSSIETSGHDPMLDGITRYRPTVMHGGYFSGMEARDFGTFVLFSDLPALLAKVRADEREHVSLEFQDTIHACPPKGSGVMPCCSRTPFEVMGDRMTLEYANVTCGRWKP